MSTTRTDRETALGDVRSPQLILRSIVAALNGRNISEAVAVFNNHFTFTDHALGLAFNEKPRLTEFFQKSRELFPDTVVTVTSTLESGNHAIAEWTLTATEVLHYAGSVNFRKPFSLPGISVVEIEEARIIRWSDYYDLATSRRMALGAFFEEWIEL
jgi:steroid delta-isomerase-like uncharacterized protein